MKNLIPISVAYIVGWIAGKNEQGFWVIGFFIGSYAATLFLLKFLGKIWKIPVIKK